MSIKDIAGNRFASKKFKWKNFKGRDSLQVDEALEVPSPALGARGQGGKTVARSCSYRGRWLLPQFEGQSRGLWNKHPRLSLLPPFDLLLLPPVGWTHAETRQQKAEIGLGGNGRENYKHSPGHIILFPKLPLHNLQLLFNLSVWIFPSNLSLKPMEFRVGV